MADKSGQASALTVLTPIADGHEAVLRAYLAGLPLQEESPLARIGTTHFSRWLVLHDLVYEGPPQVQDSLKSPYLIFTSNFDGDQDEYLHAMAAAMPEEADAIWSHCIGYPGSADPVAFAKYLTHNQIHTTFFVSAYPDAKVPTVRAALATRAKLIAFAVAHQRTPRDQLKEAMLAEFAPGVRS